FFEGACAKVVVSGAAGQVGYALLPLIAGGGNHSGTQVPDVNSATVR
uniref:Aromatic L-alpha-hydroxyacid dehydrogenase, AHADH (Fragments) n=1 Tax=Trypanosoma cruzi TaxID=5693 RepID=Q9TXF8_TRYCR